MRLWDYDIWQGLLKMDYTLRFGAGSGDEFGTPDVDSQATGAERLLKSELGPFDNYCALPDQSDAGDCAIEGRALGGVTVFDKQLIFLEVSLPAVYCHVSCAT